MSKQTLQLLLSAEQEIVVHSRASLNYLIAFCADGGSASSTAPGILWDKPVPSKALLEGRTLGKAGLRHWDVPWGQQAQELLSKS